MILTNLLIMNIQHIKIIQYDQNQNIKYIQLTQI